MRLMDRKNWVHAAMYGLFIVVACVLGAICIPPYVDMVRTYWGV